MHISRPERFLNYTSAAILIMTALYFAMRIGVTIGEGRVVQVVVTQAGAQAVCDQDGNAVPCAEVQ